MPNSCPCPHTACPGDDFLCDGVMCISSSMVCDGMNDCADATDEENCGEFGLGQGTYRILGLGGGSYAGKVVMKNHFFAASPQFSKDFTSSQHVFQGIFVFVVAD